MPVDEEDRNHTPQEGVPVTHVCVFYEWHQKRHTALCDQQGQQLDVVDG